MPYENIALHSRIYKSQLFPVWRRHAPGIPGRFPQHVHLARELDVLEPVLRCRSHLCEEALTICCPTDPPKLKSLAYLNLGLSACSIQPHQPNGWRLRIVIGDCCN